MTNQQGRFGIVFGFCFLGYRYLHQVHGVRTNRGGGAQSSLISLTSIHLISVHDCRTHSISYSSLPLTHVLYITRDSPLNQPTVIIILQQSNTRVTNFYQNLTFF